MAHWPEPQFDPPLPPFSSSYVGAWFAHFEAALELNHIWIQEFKHAVLLDVLPLALQLHLGVPSPGPRPYDELRQRVLDFFGATYHPLPVPDRTVRESLPAFPPPALPASKPPVPGSHHQASLPLSTCPDTVSSTARCATAQSPASGSLQGSLSCAYAHHGVTKGIDTTAIPATSSPGSPPTVTRDSGAITDPTPVPEMHAIGSGANDIAPAIRSSTYPSPDFSTLPAEQDSESARELCPVPTPLPPTVSAVAKPRHLPASESAAAAAATFFHALRSPSSPSANLPLGPSSDFSGKSDVGGWEQSSRHTDTADGLTPPCRDASRDGVSQPPPDPVLSVVPTLQFAKQHDPAAAAPALPDLRQPAPVPSLSVVRRRLPRRQERHWTPTPQTMATPRLQQAPTRRSCLDSGGVARKILQLTTSTAGRARPDKRVHKRQAPELTHLRARDERVRGLSCPPMRAPSTRSFRLTSVNYCRGLYLLALRAGVLCAVRPQRHSQPRPPEGLG